jgi:membrane-associated protease RseP (regulator of RpoE activity)
LSENPEVEPLVRSAFTIRDTFSRGDGSTEYSVQYDGGSKAAFKTLYVKLGTIGFTPHLSGSEENAVLVVTKNEEPPQSTARTPVFLLLLSVVAIIATGWGVGIIYSQAVGGNVLLVGASFVLAVTAVLISRDLAQRFVARRRGNVSSLQYYLPNIPLFVSLPVLYYLPTFGSITFLRSPTIDRDALFDFYFLGAIAGVAVAFVVALVGAPDAVVYAVGQSGSTLSSNPSLLQTLALTIGGNSLTASTPSGEVALFSPIEIAAWIGFLISFFSLVPAALLDGGRMATLVLGERGSRITTMVTAFLLVAIDVPNYWVLFLLIFLLAAIQPSNETLDSISGISQSRRFLFLFAMLLVVLCIPIPQTFLTRPI